MRNEIILILALVVTYGLLIAFYRLFGKSGLYVWTAVATISANIEVLILVHAFGMDMTLGNILFASTFLVTDILSELYGKKTANKAVKLGIAVNISFIIISQSWFLYAPADGDWASPAIREIFSNTPRLMLVSLLVYAIVQTFDVWAYHAIWSKTSSQGKDRRKFLWLRNNGSTLVSQFLNTLLFNVGAFVGIYDFKTLVSIVISGYIIFVVTSLLDTPFVYWARSIKERGHIKEDKDIA